VLLYCTVLYCILLYCIVLSCIVANCHRVYTYLRLIIIIIIYQQGYLKAIVVYALAWGPTIRGAPNSLAVKRLCVKTYFLLTFTWFVPLFYVYKQTNIKKLQHSLIKSNCSYMFRLVLSHGSTGLYEEKMCNYESHFCNFNAHNCH
jgi:hypothetical protein